MKKSYLLVGLLSLVIIGAGAYAYSASTQPETQESQTSTSGTMSSNDTAAPNNSDVTNEPTPAPTTAEPGIYTDYNEEKVASASGTKLLFFHAPWCPQCRELEESIKTSTLPRGLTIFKVDYDSNQALRQQYGVTIQTTVVKIDKNGDKVDSYVAYEDPTFSNVEAALLQ